jgi:hypothetical protein
MSICKYSNTPCLTDAVFCHTCGGKIEKSINIMPSQIPQTMTVAEAAAIFFNGKVSPGLVYQAVREHRLPHVKMSSGKVLLDVDELTRWWADELKKSRLTTVKGGLRKID